MRRYSTEWPAASYSADREQLTEIVFSPVRKSGESWIERLQWLLMTDGFGFYSPLSCEEAPRS
ncbi:hypothetical protein CXT15_22805 [Salmonella enterica]|nr:hypothetical protein [Salmonella enterica]EBU4459913.1 hypothetical protein [Salmonella enterica]ECX7228404.1 hypothetical protein [Salmonella enterica]ECX8703856.1 hypothetical protein [Salmonella enterica]